MSLLVIRGPELAAIVVVGWLLMLYMVIGLTTAAAREVPVMDELDGEEPGEG